ncbi:peptidylprolyl isomerase [Deferribacter abyssi]|uniref:peptidylprolyl isomerase n=1 Tax=Deferribacter abyssi TaxID=213806 RepID=UPI003C1F7042
MKYILSCVKILVFITVLVHSNLLFAQEKIIAIVNGEKIHYFEVKTFLNKVIPIGKFHVQSLNKKEFWDEAIESAVNARTIVLYLKKNKPKLYEKVDNKAKEIVDVIKKRFKSNEDYIKALNENGISENILIDTYRDLNVKEIIKEEIFKEKISDDILKNYYDNNLGMFSTGAFYIVKNCLIEADARELNPKQMEEKKKEAEKILLLIKEGDKKVWSKCNKGKYPDEDKVYKFSKNYPVDKIFSLKVGDVGGPYKNIYGYLIVKVIDEKPSEVVPYKEIKSEIERLMKQRKFKDYYKEILKRAKDEATIKIFDNNNSR